MGAFAVRWSLDPLLHGHAPLMLFILASIIATLYGGLGPGLLAMVAGALLGDYFFITPLHTLGPKSTVEWAYSLTFLVETGAAIAVTDAMRRAKERAQKAEWLAQSRDTERRQVEEKVLRLNTELEQRVRERTTALEAANRELEAFSYSVSHDLRAPLRSINGFSQALQEEYGPQLDPRGQRYLDYTLEASQRMGRLIEDLMKLSRASRGELGCQPVDLSELATVIIEQFRKREPQRQVDVLIAPKLLADGDPGLLRIALENLLDNAWKFTAKRPQPRIELGSTQTNGAPHYFVRDNGAGFNMAYSDRLFGVFQRFHSEKEFPGTGVGLATVRRIFARHGGEVWAEAKPNQGATFYFTLPNGHE